MRRIGLAGVVALGLLATSPSAEAQPAKVSRIGFLTTGTPRSAPMVQAFEQRLRELGYTEDQNLVIEFRSAEGNVNRLPGLAVELAGLNADLIVTGTDPATRAVKDATSTILILMVAINFDPIARGHVTSLARPGENVTGVFFMHIDLMAKRFQLFKEMLPAVSRVAVLSDSFAVDQLKTVQAQNASMGSKFKLQPLEVRGRRTTSMACSVWQCGLTPKRFSHWSLSRCSSSAPRSLSLP